jgi:hypothetical protein
MNHTIALYDMVHRYVRYNGYGLTIIQVILYGQKFTICYDEPLIQWLFCDRRTMHE